MTVCALVAVVGAENVYAGCGAEMLVARTLSVAAGDEEECELARVRGNDRLKQKARHQRR